MGIPTEVVEMADEIMLRDHPELYPDMKLSSAWGYCLRTYGEHHLGTKLLWEKYSEFHQRNIAILVALDGEARLQ